MLWGQKGRLKKEVQMRRNGEGAKGTCWAPAPGVSGLLGAAGRQRQGDHGFTRPHEPWSKLLKGGNIGDYVAFIGFRVLG